MRVKRKQNPRIVILVSLMLAIFMIFGFRAANFQVVTADDFALENAHLTAIKTKIPATRGEIVDCYGRPIATNRDGYCIVFNSAYMKKADYNSTILALTELMSLYECEWTDNLPMSNVAPYDFTDEKNALRLKSKLGLNDYATAENCYDEMVERYSLETYNDEDKRVIMGVRYSMERADFSVSNPFTFSEDIPSELMLTVAESFTHIRGIEINVVSYRRYTDSQLAPHTIGTIGKINAEEWETLKDKGYSYNDYVGKSGVEKAFESYLKGQDGEMTYYFDKSGNVVKTEITKQPVQGNTVFLTIDSTLQKVAQDALANNIKLLNSKGQNITGGSVVITKVKTGEVLTSANYPSYDLENLSDYLSGDVANNPLFDRALRGTYPPGSAFKPMVAIAGLQEQIVEPYDTVFCSRKYTYYADYQPSCMHYHKTVNVFSAISQSCNYYFFDLGRQVGITRLNAYAKKMGLGVKTGIELSESSGILAGPEYSKSVGSQWYDGMTLAASIGQSDNAFTPIQLANFTATIANGGTRYKTTLLKTVKAAGTNNTVFDMSPQVNDTIGAQKAVMDAVKQGMKSVTSEGTASAYFADYPINIGGKTGTAQTTGPDNSVLILFAPYEDPEIAVSIVVEHGEKSTSTGPVAKAIMDEYFFGSSEPEKIEKPNELLR